MKTSRLSKKKIIEGLQRKIEFWKHKYYSTLEQLVELKEILYLKKKKPL